LLPGGTLGVFYRVYAPQQSGGAHFVVGYVSRPVEVAQAGPAPTFTPQPTSNRAVGVAISTPTSFPTPDLTNVTPPSVGENVRLQIGLALAAVLVVSAVALFQLLRGRR
jgi:hypothetical protein